MRRMHLGESGARFSLPARWRPLVPWLPILLRGIQAVFSLVSVACVASMNHPAAMCEAMIADTDSLPASTVASLSALVDNAICLPGRNYKNFQSLEFLVRFIFIFVRAIGVTVYFLLLTGCRHRRDVRVVHTFLTRRFDVLRVCRPGTDRG